MFMCWLPMRRPMGLPLSSTVYPLDALGKNVGRGAGRSPNPDKSMDCKLFHGCLSVTNRLP